MAKSDNDERARRILDVAVDLFVHYGYDKTTVDEIARAAGVSKGAIYLHFGSKDDLLEGLIKREMQTYSERWLALIEADPDGGSIASMYKNSLYALSSSPFMFALFKQDGRVLGNYLRKPGNFFQEFRERQTESPRYIFVKMMQDAGAVRQDIDPKVTAHIMDILAYGLVGMDGIIPAQDIPPIEEIIEGIALLMDRALTPDGGGNREAGKLILRQIAEGARLQFQQMEE